MIDINNYPKYRDVLMFVTSKTWRIRISKMFKHISIPFATSDMMINFLPLPIKHRLLNHCFDDMICFIFDCAFKNQQNEIIKNKKDLLNAIMISQQETNVLNLTLNLSSRYNFIDFLTNPISILIKQRYSGFLYRELCLKAEEINNVIKDFLDKKL